jgi:hypothetical protein
VSRRRKPPTIAADRARFSIRVDCMSVQHRPRTVGTFKLQGEFASEGVRAGWHLWLPRGPVEPGEEGKQWAGLHDLYGQPHHLLQCPCGERRVVSVADADLALDELAGRGVSVVGLADLAG